MDATVKDVLAAIRPAEDVDEQQAPHGAFDVILSTPSKDRDGEEVGADEWKTPLPDHITFDIDHGMSVASTVGSGRPEVQPDGTLRVRGTYASTPQAQQVRALVNEGHIRTTSVAFIRRTKQQKDGARSVERELLNGAFVAVPANPEAVVLASKGVRSPAQNLQAGLEYIRATYGIKAPDPDAGDTAALVQAVHDASSALGAACPDPSLGDGPTAGTGSKAAAPDGTPASLAQAVDAALDEAMPLLDSIDATTLPEPVQQAIGLVQAAGAAADQLLAAMDVPDPDDAPDDDSTSDDDTEVAVARYRALRSLFS